MAEVFYRTQALEAIARQVLTRHDPFYLNLPPQAVPLETIIEDVFGLTIEYMRLTVAGDELGRMIYDDGYSTRFNTVMDNYELVTVKRGTMLIEAGLLESPKLYGRFRFTLAHELAHWVLHQKLYAGTGTAAATFGMGSHIDDATEWQANYLARAMLLPAGQVKRCFYRSMSDRTGGEVLNLAGVFMVSRQVAEIRLKELGLCC